MDAQQEQGQRTGGTVARRGLLAGAAALVAAVLAKASQQAARAANGDAWVIGNTAATGGQTATAATELDAAVNGTALVIVNTDGRGAAASFETFSANIANGGPGIVAFGAEVTGGALLTAGPGVSGTGGDAASAGQTAGAGVVGTGGTGPGRVGVGVRGNSGGRTIPGSIGVLGISDPNSPNLADPTQPAGVYGLSNSSAAGVIGQSNNGSGIFGSSNSNVGVLGVSNASVGVFAHSISQYGLYATSDTGAGIVASTNNGNAIQGASNGNVGVLGTSISSIGGFFASSTSTGLFASGPASGFAARFDGPVLVNGNFTAIGGAKSAAVPHPDGSYRRLYCVEAPESWFEDFGEGRLDGDQATVRLDPDFAALVRGSEYHVFLTSHDAVHLHVRNRGPESFEVHVTPGVGRAADLGRAGAVTFSYRVVARRKDIAGPRLERVDVPAPPQRPAPPLAPPALPRLAPPQIDPNAAPVARRSAAR
jgi:hypothetical protein